MNIISKVLHSKFIYNKLYDYIIEFHFVDIRDADKSITHITYKEFQTYNSSEIIYLLKKKYFYDKIWYNKMKNNKYDIMGFSITIILGILALI